ncbi:lytic murein transglycosylase [Qipengyuania sp. 1NDW9]|uniref:lytic murein transglycosylase n=1 Tax=Qipengyuania xiapuensis TaxID=2867236 RepID=UPI001C874C40|nr:lytic murein transglycosylase [Qipengyuania xiapuensis]MBX7493105.1 lytic murein transglycosylase [Qipengyuania xiapuensis]
MKFSRLFALGLASLIALPPLPASAQDMSFDAYLQLLIARSRAAGVSEATIQRMTDGLTPNRRVIELDQSQPGTPTISGYPPLAPYVARLVDDARINGGRRAYARYRGDLARIEREYGVPAEILVAIWGKETAYGNVKGGFDLSQALATLAWEGRRRELFSSEFVALMQVADKGYSRSELKGSWAGAFGNPQFLPSVYLRLAADGNGDGRADILNDPVDALASIANYLRDAGWREGEPWGVRAYVPSGFDVDRYRTKIVAPSCVRVHERHSVYKTVAEWRSLGIQPQIPLPENTLVTLFQPDGPGTNAYLLTSNYRAILEYNCSNYYAMGVGILSDEITR